MLGGAAIRSLGRSVQMSSLNSGALYIGLHLVIFGLLIYGFHRRNFEATVLLTVVVSFAIFGAPYAFVAWLERRYKLGWNGAGGSLLRSGFACNASADCDHLAHLACEEGRGNDITLRYS